MSEESTTTIKFGPGYEAPWFVAKGDLETQKQEICRVFGLSPHTAGKTLAEYIVDASAIATALQRSAVKAASQGYGPETTIKAVGPPSNEPADHAGTTGLEALIHEARNVDELAELYTKNKHLWTDELTLLARKRRRELEAVAQ